MGGLFCLADTALADVKLAELPSWPMRRQIGLSPAAGAVSRGESLSLD